MMAALFLLFGICLFLIITKERKPALYLALVNLVLCFLMLLHHATSILEIRL